MSKSKGVSIPPKPKRGIPPKPLRVGAVKRIVLDVDPEMHRRFKAACAAQGTTIKAEVVGFIERRLRFWG